MMAYFLYAILWIPVIALGLFVLSLPAIFFGALFGPIGVVIYFVVVTAAIASLFA